MSIVKGYMVKEDLPDDLFWDFSESIGFYSHLGSGAWLTPNRKEAELVASKHDGILLTVVDGSKYQPVNLADEAKVAGVNITGNVTSISDYDIEGAIKVLVNGFKLVRFILPLSDTEDEYANLQYVYHYLNKWRISSHTNVGAACHKFPVTQQDIDSAPAWVKAIKPVEVNDVPDKE